MSTRNNPARWMTGTCQNCRGPCYKTAKRCAQCVAAHPTHRICAKCRRTFPKSEFPSRGYCRDCATEYERHRIRLKKYGVDAETVEAMLIAQGNRCAICTGELLSTGHDGVQVDHCHTTDRVRGLLCRRCNLAIGLFEDDIELLQWAIDYLTEHAADVRTSAT